MVTNEITRKELIAELAKDEVIMIEVLPKKYYQQGHLPGALQLNHDEVDDKAESMLLDKHAFIVTYCSDSTCPNSGIAVSKLKALGYTKVKKYVGGKQDWTDAGETLEVS